ncbi:hypothetical protein B0A48_06144 [Cryoendolithus antarcticus]|uniref:Uncharacterized protein n=1 Tax=Cryoendolithus antarcticus TaxID=1507870 RepID=A0A1V8TAH3_9PEZI|nr:hypothetical protein B0A48_06144 [Cryoendolithus antarcticus]
MTTPQASIPMSTPSPFTDPFTAPTAPKPCAQVSPRTSREAAWVDVGAEQTHTVNYTGHDRTAANHQSVSMSSAGTLTSLSASDPEKGSPPRTPPRHSRQHSHTSTIDEEKAAYLHAYPPSMPRAARQSQRRRPSDASGSTIYSMLGEEDPGQAAQEQHALKILLFLSFPVVLLSWLNLFWAIISLLITTLSQPVRICARRLSFGTQLSSLLGPALNLQLRAIYTPLPPFADEDGCFHPGSLLLVHLTAPFLSMGVALAAWVLAAYWLMAGMVGDPAGMDRRDDGMETVLGLRRWWESVLMKGVQQSRV